MSRPRFYYYDHEACAFAEVRPDPRRLLVRAGAAFGLAFVFAAFGWSALVPESAASGGGAPAEEVEALRAQLGEANARLAAFAGQLENLAEADRELYRTVLQAEPVALHEPDAPEPARREGARFSGPTSRLLLQTSATLDRLEGQLAYQARSYDQLRALAGERDGASRQEPAILPLKDARLSSGFGMRYHPILHTMRMHSGVDFPAPEGTPVYATADGVVGAAGTRGGYGVVLDLHHPLSGKLTRYAHLSAFAEGIREGVAVRRGQVVAFTGNTGLSTAPHLHYEVRALDGTQAPLNPVPSFVPGVSPQEYQALVEAGRVPTVSFD